MSPPADGVRREAIRDRVARLDAAISIEERVELLNEISASLAPMDAKEALRYGFEALQLAEDTVQASAEATAHQSIAHAYWRSGQHDQAIVHSETALRQFNALGDKQAAGRTAQILGSVYFGQSRLAKATEVTLQAMQLADESEDSQGLAIAHNTLGVLYKEGNQLEKALEHRLQSARIHEENGDRYRLAMALINVGNIFVFTNDAAGARPHYDRAVDLLEEIEPKGYPIAAAYHNLGDVHRLEGNTELAQSFFLKGRALREESGDECGAVASLNALGQLAQQQRNCESACEHFELAREQATRLELWKEAHTACLGLSQVHEQLGNFREAYGCLQEAVQFSQKLHKCRDDEHAAELRERYDAERKEREAEIYQVKYVELLQETTKRVAAEKALLQAQKRESLGLLAGGVAHDFNNLLLCGLGYSDLAKSALEEEHEARRFLSLSDESCRRAVSIAQQMLTYSGRASYNIESCEPAHLVEAHLDVLRRARAVDHSNDGRLELRLAVVDPLPRIRADRAQVAQVLTSVIDNASEAGASKVTVTLKLLQLDEGRYRYAIRTGFPLESGTYLSMAIQDNGSGMDSDTMDKIFDPFFSTRDPARGLGLAAVLGVIRGHGGGVVVESEPGEGATLEVIFPRDSEPRSAACESDVEPPQFQGEPAILVIDDEPLVLKFLSTALERAGYRVFAASEGLAGIQIYREEREKIGMVLLDMTMPGPSPHKVWKTLQSIHSSAKIVLTSGYDQEQSLRLFPEGVEFLPKPFRQDLLLEVVKRNLQSRKGLS